MARSLAPDRERASRAFLAAIAMLAYPTALGQILIIVLAGLVGWWWLSEASAPRDPGVHLSIGHRGAAVAWVLFFGLLVGLPIAQQWVQSEALAVFDSFFRVGSLVFGGGHVVLPLLQAEVVPPGWVTNEQFVAGYGAAQAVPGPLFTFAAYLGAVMRPLGGGAAPGCALSARVDECDPYSRRRGPGVSGDRVVALDRAFPFVVIATCPAALANP